jgi:hypothetical protein
MSISSYRCRPLRSALCSIVWLTVCGWGFLTAAQPAKQRWLAPGVPEPAIVTQSRELDALRQAEYEAGLGFAVPGLARHSEYGANEGISQIERFNALQRAEMEAEFRLGTGMPQLTIPGVSHGPVAGDSSPAANITRPPAAPLSLSNSFAYTLPAPTPFDWSPFLTPIIYLPILIAIGALATRLGSGSRPRKTGANADAR